LFAIEKNPNLFIKINSKALEIIFKQVRTVITAVTGQNCNIKTGQNRNIQTGQ
jgi:hypothetical protein